MAEFGPATTSAVMECANDGLRGIAECFAKRVGSDSAQWLGAAATLCAEGHNGKAIEVIDGLYSPMARGRVYVVACLPDKVLEAVGGCEERGHKYDAAYLLALNGNDAEARATVNDISARASLSLARKALVLARFAPDEANEMLRSVPDYLPDYLPVIEELCYTYAEKGNEEQVQQCLARHMVNRQTTREDQARVMLSIDGFLPRMQLLETAEEQRISSRYSDMIDAARAAAWANRKNYTEAFGIVSNMHARTLQISALMAIKRAAICHAQHGKAELYRPLLLTGDSHG